MEVNAQGVATIAFSMAYQLENETIDGNSTPPADSGPYPGYGYVRYVCFCILGLIIPLGLVCNIFSLVVFATSTTLRRTTTGQYLAALAVADWLVILGELIVWLNTRGAYSTYILNLNFAHTSQFACKLMHYLRYAGMFASAWITVVITAERFITIAMPLKIASLSTSFLARLTISVIFLVSFGLGAYPWWTIGVASPKGYPQCAYIDRNQYTKWDFYIIRVFNLIVPSCIVLFLTACVLVVLHRARQLRKKKLLSGGQAFKAVERQLTAMLLLVAVAFVFLRLPYIVAYYIILYKHSFWGKDITNDVNFKLYATKEAFRVVYVLNYAVNFFLYSVSGSSFRQQILKLFRLKKRTFRKSTTQSTLLSSRHSSRSSPTNTLQMSVNRK